MDEAKLKAGLTFLTGFETQFVLLRPQEEHFVDQAGWGSSRAHRTGSTEGSVLEEIAENLLEVGIEVQAVHAAPGQGQVTSISTCNFRKIHLPPMIMDSTKLLQGH